MVNWGQIRKKGKVRFIFLYGMTVSLPFVLDYYIIKFFLNSFQVKFNLIELFVVWISCIVLGKLIALYGWSRMEKDWLRKASEKEGGRRIFHQ